MRGAINRNLLTILAKNGFNITREMYEKCSNQGSGHDNLRYAVNLMISILINSMLSYLY